MIDPQRHRRERIIAAAIVLVVAALVAGVVIYNRTVAEQVLKQTYVPRETKITPELEMLRHYVRIDTSNPPGNERPGAEWLAGILAANGIHYEIIEPAPRRSNLYARIKGRRTGEGLLLLNHIDVVPATPSEWTRPAFSAEIFLNEMYGRGTLDMKSIAICELLAFIDIARSGRSPERDVVFLAVADEEAESTWGMAWLVQHRPDLFAGIRYSINEGGITEMVQERVTYFGIEVGTKQVVTLLLRAASREQLQQTRIALEPWFIRREPERISPEVKAWMRDLAPQRIAFRNQLADIDKTVTNGDFWELPQGYREMTQDNLWAETVERRGNEWEMRTHLLDLPDTNPDERISWLQSKIAPFGTRIHEVVRKDGPVPLSSPHTPFFQLLAREAKRIFGAPVGVEILNRSANDSRFLRKRGVQAYGITPPVNFYQAETLHRGNERIRPDYFEQGVVFVRRVVAEYAFGR
ncbi:MAG TPA: M20/M25/M40 family metallo-hydrolase [Thermoanaerobaculia bacterium]